MLIILFEHLEQEGKKEMFYVMMYSTYLWLYGIRHMVKDHTDSQRGNPLPPLHGLLFLISSKGLASCFRQDSTDRIAKLGVEHWLKCEHLEQIINSTVTQPCCLRYAVI